MLILTLQLKMPSLIYNGDIGARTVISTLNTTIPVTTTITLILKKPDDTIVTLIPAPGGIDYATGVITYASVSGDFTLPGQYRIQVHAVFADGDDLTSNIGTFTVYEKIE
jgi:hypothetical protein